MKKLNRIKQNGTKKALNRAEVRRILDFLKEDKSVRGLENYAVFRLLYATGLRGQELCNMKWGDIEFDEDAKGYFVNGIGKGGKAFRQEVVDPDAMRAVKIYFNHAFKRKPKPEDHVFWTVPSYNGDICKPLNYNVLYHRIVDIGEAVRKAGIQISRLW